MDYKEYKPSKEISHLVECFWTNTLHPEDFQQDYDYIIPDGSADAVFMLNGNYLRHDETNQKTSCGSMQFYYSFSARSKSVSTPVYDLPCYSV